MLRRAVLVGSCSLLLLACGDETNDPIDNPLTNPESGPPAGNPDGDCEVPDDARTLRNCRPA